jgi:hypothetical protein
MTESDGYLVPKVSNLMAAIQLYEEEFAATLGYINLKERVKDYSV